MIDRAAAGLDNEPDHTHPFEVPGIADLIRLSRAMGGGSYPGLGAGQNDSLGFPDSIAPGFPLNIPFVIPGNLVKQQAYKVSFIPAPFRTYSGATGVSAAPHAHSGDTVQTLSIDHTHATGNELSGHKHRWFETSGQVTTSPTTTPPNLGKWLEGKVYDSGGNWVNNGNLVALDNDDANIHTNDLWTETDVAQSQNHAHNANANGGAVLTSHSHTSVSDTGGEQIHTHSGSNQVSEGTSPDAIHLMVDGTDVTTQLGGPWTTQQFELDATPFVGPGAGIHTVQLTSQTNLGRITGWVRQANIVNPIAP